MSAEARPGPTPDEAGFRQWLTLRGPLLRRKAYLMCGDWHLADDICQDVFVKLYTRWSKIVKGGNVDGYANRVLVGCYVDSTRRPWRRERSSEVLPEFADSTADEALSRIDGGDEALERALAGLPANQRAVVVLRFTDDLTVDEIARELNIPAGTVKSRLSRGIESLREALSLGSDSPDAAPASPSGSVEILSSNVRASESLS